MYNIPVTNYPNQTFQCTIPVNGENKEFTMQLNYNPIAEYWSLTLVDSLTEKVIFSQLPLLSTIYQFWSNMVFQLTYKEFGEIYIVPIGNDVKTSAPDSTNLGSTFCLLWGDNQWLPGGERVSLNGT